MVSSKSVDKISLCYPIEMCYTDRGREMDSHFRRMAVTASFLVLLALGCKEGPSDQPESANDRKSEHPSAAESIKSFAAMPNEGIGDTHQAISEQSVQGQQGAPVEGESTTRVPPGGIPDEKERNAILDRVNRGPGLPECRDEGGATGPASRTESDERTKTP